MALRTNLTAAGWTCLPNQRPGPELRLAGALLLAGWQERPRDLVVEFVASGALVVAVGSLRWPRPLIAAVEAGADAVVDPDLPFVELLDTVVAVLSAAEHPRLARRQDLLAALRARQREVELLARLTAREREVLGALAAGHQAARIASAMHLSMATVRSHIHSIMHKLEVSSQLTAVAVGRRGDRELSLGEVRMVHQ